MRLPAIITRLVGLWILAGAFMKLLYGTPADLPEVLLKLPLRAGLILQLAIAGEMVVGGLALLRPSRGWLPAKILTGLFLVVLVTQVVGGEESCGCFGTAVTISPLVMLVIDGIAFALLVLVRPWRLERDQAELPWAVTALVLVACATLPWVFDREASTAEIAAGTKDPTDWVVLDVASWRGKPLKDTSLYPLLKPDQRLEEGVIILWQATCPVCAEHLENLALSQLGHLLVLLELPVEEGDDGDVQVRVLPEGPGVSASKLPAARWFVTAPVHVEVKGGMVVKALEGHAVVEGH
jgi:hypothetical protein